MAILVDCAREQIISVADKVDVRIECKTVTIGLGCLDTVRFRFRILRSDAEYAGERCDIQVVDHYIIPFVAPLARSRFSYLTWVLVVVFLLESQKLLLSRDYLLINDVLYSTIRQFGTGYHQAWPFGTILKCFRVGTGSSLAQHALFELDQAEVFWDQYINRIVHG